MNLSILARCGLFRGIETAELSPLLRRLHACTREFDKFQPIYRVGDTRLPGHPYSRNSIHVKSH